MRTIRPLPPVCRALLAVEHDWPALLADHQATLRRVYSELGEVLAQPSPLEKLMAKKPKPKPKPKPGC